MSTSNEFRTRISVLSILLVLLLTIVSLTGLLYPSIYDGATPNWLAQTVGQDVVDLFLIVPVLVISSLYTILRNRMALYLWLGTLLYLIYTFIIYCFAVRFNVFFIAYCIILGLSLFALLTNFPGLAGPPSEGSNRLYRITGIYFIVISVLFYLLWLSEIIPAILSGRTPPSLHTVGLITNPVHVLDLSALLPATFIIGLLAIRGKAIVRHWVPVLLVFFILMDITIAVLTVVMVTRGIDGDLLIAIAMASLAIFSTVLFAKLTHRPSYESQPV